MEKQQERRGCSVTQFNPKQHCIDFVRMSEQLRMSPTVFIPTTELFFLLNGLFLPTKQLGVVGKFNVDITCLF